MLPLLLSLAAFVVACSNGANANFKGVASLHGSGTTGYRPAVRWAALTTAAGAVTALFLMQPMLRVFRQGAGPEALLSQPVFFLAVASAAPGAGPPDRRTRTLDALHFLNAGAVWFARSLVRFYLKCVAGYPDVRRYEGAWKEYVRLKGQSLPALAACGAAVSRATGRARRRRPAGRSCGRWHRRAPASPLW